MTKLTEVCDHCGKDLGEHLVPDSRCPTPGATTYFFMAAYARCICGLGHYDYVTPEACPVHGAERSNDD